MVSPLARAGTRLLGSSNSHLVGSSIPAGCWTIIGRGGYSRRHSSTASSTRSPPQPSAVWLGWHCGFVPSPDRAYRAELLARDYNAAAAFGIYFAVYILDAKQLPRAEIAANPALTAMSRSRCDWPCRPHSCTRDRPRATRSVRCAHCDAPARPAVLPGMRRRRSGIVTFRARAAPTVGHRPQQWS